jgi:protein-S-isoprenylcysteine O-methyltransferase Ste14
MYLSFIILGIGQALLLANWIAGLAGLAATALLIAVRLPHEEAMMIEAFGDDSRDYMRRTGGILPRLGQG